MSIRISTLFYLFALLMHFGELSAAPLDVDGDGLVGPQEAIDLAESWKGPALPAGDAQPWQIDSRDLLLLLEGVQVETYDAGLLLEFSGAWEP